MVSICGKFEIFEDKTRIIEHLSHQLENVQKVTNNLAESLSGLNKTMNDEIKYINEIQERANKYADSLRHEREQKFLISIDENLSNKKIMELKEINNKLFLLKDFGVQEELEDYLYQGNLFFHSGLYEKALDMYNLASEMAPNNAENWLYKGYIFLKTCKYKDAINCFDNTLKINPIFINAYFFKCLSLIHLHLYEDALQVFDSLSKIESNYIEVMFCKSKLLVAFGKYEDAIKTLDQMLRITPSRMDIWFQKAIVYFKLRDHESFSECFDFLRQSDFEDAESWFNIGTMLCEFGMYKNALGAFNKVLNTEPENVKALYLMIDCMSRLSNCTNNDEIFMKNKKISDGRKPKEINNHKKHDRKNNKVIVYPKDFEELLKNGCVFVKNGQHEKALDVFDKALVMRPDDSKVWESRGLTLLRMDLIDEALKAFSNALMHITIYPKNLLVDGSVCDVLDKYESQIKLSNSHSCAENLCTNELSTREFIISKILLHEHTLDIDKNALKEKNNLEESLPEGTIPEDYSTQKNTGETSNLQIDDDYSSKEIIDRTLNKEVAQKIEYFGNIFGSEFKYVDINSKSKEDKQTILSKIEYDFPFLNDPETNKSLLIGSQEEEYTFLFEQIYRLSSINSIMTAIIGNQGSGKSHFFKNLEYRRAQSNDSMLVLTYELKDKIPTLDEILSFIYNSENFRKLVLNKERENNFSLCLGIDDIDKYLQLVAATSISRATIDNEIVSLLGLSRLILDSINNVCVIFALTPISYEKVRAIVSGDQTLRRRIVIPNGVDGKPVEFGQFNEKEAFELVAKIMAKWLNKNDIDKKRIIGYNSIWPFGEKAVKLAWRVSSTPGGLIFIFGGALKEKIKMNSSIEALIISELDIANFVYTKKSNIYFTNNQKTWDDIEILIQEDKIKCKLDRLQKKSVYNSDFSNLLEKGLLKNAFEIFFYELGFLRDQNEPSFIIYSPKKNLNISVEFVSESKINEPVAKNLAENLIHLKSHAGLFICIVEDQNETISFDENAESLFSTTEVSYVTVVGYKLVTKSEMLNIINLSSFSEHERRFVVKYIDSKLKFGQYLESLQFTVPSKTYNS